MVRQRMGLWVGALGVALLASGCVAKKQHDEVVAKLAACEAERTQAVTAVAACQENTAQEAQRWEELATSLQTQAPAVLGQIEAEKSAFLQQLPEAVRTQVDSYLAKFAGDVRKAFAVMREENQKLAAQVEQVGATAGRTEGKADAILGRMEQRERSLLADAERVQKGVVDVAAQITEFDRTVINCRDCPEKLSLSRKERETITAFHSRLVDSLNGLRTAGAGAPSEDAAPPETGDSGGSH